MANVNWVGAASPDNEWSFAGAWSNNAVPGSGDTITVPTSTPTLVLTSVTSGGPNTFTAGNITIAAATVASGGSWSIQAYPHTVTVTGNLEVDGGMSVITDPFDTASMTLNIGGTLIVTNSGGGIGIGGYGQGAISGQPGVATTVLVKAAAVTNNSGTNNGTITIQSDVTDGSTATLDVSSAAGVSGQTGVLVGNFNIGSDGLHAGGAGLLEFDGGGEITTIQGASANFAGASLFIYGSQSFVAVAGALTSNSALIGLAMINGHLTLQAGAAVSPAGAVTIGSNGAVAVDVDFEGVAGSKFAVGGVAGAMLTVNGSLSIGRGAMTGDGLVTASALSSTGSISVDGADASDMGELEIGSAAGFGTAGTLTGNVELQDFSLLEFAGGAISTIAQGAQLEISSPHAFLAVTGALTSNSALAGLTTVNGNITVQDGVHIAPTGSVTVGSNGSISLDTGFLATAGSVFAVTNTLTDNGSISIGRGAMTGTAEITAGTLMGNGSISIDGADASDKGEFIASSAAGFGGTGVVAGSIVLQDYSLLQFANGQINTINFGGSVEILGANSFLADSVSTSSNSALAGLGAVNGAFLLQDGAAVTTNAGLSVGNGTNGASVSVEGGTLNINGALNINDSSVNVGHPSDTTATTVTASSVTFANSAGIEMRGGTSGATLSIGSVAGFGTNGVLSNGNVDLENNSVLKFTGGEIGSIAFGSQLTIIGTSAFLADATSTSSNSALTGLTSVDGGLSLLSGSSISVASLAIGDGVHGASSEIGNGSHLGITGALTIGSNDVVTIGGGSDAAVSTVTATALLNANAININGDTANGGVDRGTLLINGSATNTGTISLSTGTFHVTGALSGAGTVNLANGAILELGASASGGKIAFGAGSSTVKVDTTTVPTDTIAGFAPGDMVDLAAHGFNSADRVTLLGGNVLDIAPAGGGAHIDLQLDPTQNFHGVTFQAISDGGTGTDLIADQAVSVAVQTATGIDLTWATLYDELANSPIAAGGSMTQYTAVDNGHFNGHAPAIKFVVTGTGFTYSGSSPNIQLTAGTITAVQEEDSVGNMLATFTGFSISATALQAAINSYTSGGSANATALNAIFLALSYSSTGAAGADNIQGGNINDTDYGTAGNDTVNGGAGTNTVDYSGLSTPGIVAIVQGAGGTVNKGGANGNDSLTNIQNIIGTTGGDVFYVDSNETVAGGGSFDYLIELSAAVSLAYGSNFNDISEFVSNVGNNTVNFGTDTNFAYLYGSTGNDTLALGTGGGYMFGEGGANVLTGGVNATNLFEGGSGGSDTMNGGGGTASNFYYADGNDQINGAGAFNTMVELVTGVTVQIGGAQYAHVQEFVADGGINAVTVANTDADFVYLYGGAGNDTLTTGSGGGYLIGEGGTNVLTGGGGINVFVADGASGVDTMNGGSGSNIYLIDATSTVHGAGTFNTVEELQQGVSVTLGGAQLGSDIQEVVLNGGANTANFSSATSAVFLYGGSGNDTLFGGTGSDFLYGGGGANAFEFQAGWGKDTIGDWTSGTSNLIDLTALSGSGVHAITDLTQTITSGNDVITSNHTGTNSITLMGVGSALTASSFHFA